MEVSHKAKLELSNIEREQQKGIDLVTFDCENVGSGSALNMQCGYRAYATPIDVPMIYKQRNCLLVGKLSGISNSPPEDIGDKSLVDFGVKPNYTPLGKELRDLDENGISLEEGDSKHLEGYLFYGIQYSDGQFTKKGGCTLKYFNSILAKTRLTRYSYGIFIRYQDMSGEEHDKFVTGKAVALEGEENPPTEFGYPNVVTNFTDPELNLETTKDVSLPSLSTLDKINKLKYIASNRKKVKWLSDLRAYYKLKKDSRT